MNESIREDRPSMPVEAIRDLAPFAAVLGWLLLFLALVGVPQIVLISGFIGLSVPVTVIVTTYVGHWIGLY